MGKRRSELEGRIEKVKDSQRRGKNMCSSIRRGETFEGGGGGGGERE